MYVFVLVNACSNVDVHISDAAADEEAVIDAYRYGVELKCGCIEFDTIEVWDPNDTLIVALNFG